MDLLSSNKEMKFSITLNLCTATGLQYNRLIHLGGLYISSMDNPNTFVYLGECLQKLSLEEYKIQNPDTSVITHFPKNITILN